MRLRVTGYYQDEYLYSMARQGLIMNYKENGVKKKQRSKLRTMRVAKKLYLKNGRLILGSRKNHI